MKRIVLVVLVLGLVGCAQTRDPQPVMLHQDHDREMSCDEIQTEYESNTQIAAEKIELNRKKDQTDVFLGFLVWPGLADFKNAEGTEGNALLDRNVFLRKMAGDKGCDVSGYPDQPERYR